MKTYWVADARLLVVDDNPATLYATSHVLRSTGWKVVEAATGTDALKLAADCPDLIVLDVNLPDIDGFEVCRILRQNPATERIAVIHLSATFTTDDAKVHGLEVGADGYLTQPVEPPVLIATVNAFLRTRQAEAEREQLLERERTARLEAERANRFKDEFLATLSHELRTPLHAIIGWAQVLQMDSTTPDERSEGLTAIERNAKAQAQMIADLLDVSRITSGKLRLDVQPVDPSAMVESALTAIMPAAAAKNIRVQKSLDPDAGSIIADPSRLQQVIWNLVNNAVKFTPKSGKIEVTLRRIDSNIEITVTDNGQGIDPMFLPRIFDRFEQGDASTTRQHGGLGLGLAIAKQLVEMHGGKISAESEGHDGGATFRVTLPVSIEDSISTTSRSSPVFSENEGNQKSQLVSLCGVRVLLVDDDADALYLLRRMLIEAGAEVFDVSSAPLALEALDDVRPDVLISDIGMPGQDGLDLIQQVRARGYSPQNLPAIALTGFAGPKDHRKALLAGFQIHVSKPVDPQELSEIIATLLGRTVEN